MILHPYLDFWMPFFSRSQLQRCTMVPLFFLVMDPTLSSDVRNGVLRVRNGVYSQPNVRNCVLDVRNGVIGMYETVC